MTTSKINGVIATSLGWTIKTFDGGGAWFKDDKLATSAPPYYTSDLNACHEMEKVLRKNQFHFVQYPIELFFVITGKQWDGDMGYFMFYYAHATALQRCVAYLRMLGLWEEG